MIVRDAHRATRPVLICLVLCFPVAASLTIGHLQAHESAQAGGSTIPAAKPGNLDAFMARVLEHRDQAWRKLHDYILSEAEGYDLAGPGGVRLNGMRREFTWYVRDGYLVRSPLRYDGVAIGEADRRRYEADWLRQEIDREKKRQEKAQADRPPGEQDAPTLEGFVDERGEPRFISEAFFLKFKFEAGNYYLAGRERLDGRDVVRVEYYPTRLFGSDADRERSREGRKRSGKDSDMERRLERDFNKVALVTLWIDPAEYQVLRYEFDNVDFGFLPARWLFRLDDVKASMTMGRVLDGVWLPRDMEIHAGLTLASGAYVFKYRREFRDYKKAETSARIRSYGRSDQ